MNKKLTIITLLAIVSLTLSGCGTKTDPNAGIKEEPKLPEVKVVTVQKTNLVETEVLLTGKIKPLRSISLIALNPGTVSAIPLEVGSKVTYGTSIAFLYDQGTESNYFSAQNNFASAQTTLTNTQSSTEENITQAELTLQKTQEALQLAINNYENQSNLTGQGYSNALTNAVLSAESALDAIYVSLISFKDILNVNVPANIFSSQNLSYKYQSKNSYELTEDMYDNISSLEITTENVEILLSDIIKTAIMAQTTADNIIKALNKTPTDSFQFTQTSKETYIAATFSKQNALSASQISLQTANQGLVNIKLSNNLTLDSYLTQKTSAELDLENVQASLNSIQQSSASQVTASQVAYDNAQNALNQAQIQQNRLIISSPLNGVISYINVEIGDEVSVGQVIGEVAQVDKLEIEVEVSPEIASALTLGQEVEINSNQTGKISVINPTADSGGGKVQVKISLDNTESGLIAESFVSVEIPVSLPTSQENIYVVPLKSVLLSSDSAKVKIIEEGKIKTITIETGQTVGDLIEIISGLETGQKIITEGADFLSEETEVQIKQ